MELSLAEQRVRRQIATELHDYLGQLLVVCRLKLNQASHRAQDTDLAQKLKDADRILQDSLSYTRSLVAELAPPGPAGIRIGHGPHLAGRTNGTAWGHGHHAGAFFLFSRGRGPGYLLFQSARELLMNVVKHADTKQALLSLATTTEGDVLTITVADSGKVLITP